MSVATANRLRRAQRLRSTAWLTLLLVAVGLLWRSVRYALGFPVWGDEAFVAVNLVDADFAALLRPLKYGQIVPLLFIWAEAVVTRTLGLSEYALRLVPFLAGLASLLLFWRFARGALPRPATLLAVGFFAAGYYIVRHGAELKPYTLDLLVSLSITLLARAVWQRPRSAGRWAALLALGVMAPWLSYPAAFVGGGAVLFLAWLVDRRRQPAVIAAWAALALLLTGSFASMWLFYGRPHAQAAARLTEISMWTMAFPPWSQPWKLPAWLVLIHTGMMFAYPHGGHYGGSAATFALFLVGCGYLWRRNRPLLLLLLAPFALTFLAASFERYPYGGSVRTSLYLAPAICLLAGAGAWVALRWGTLRLVAGQRHRGGIWLRERPWHLRNGLRAASAGFALFALGAMVGDVLKPYQSKAVLLGKQALADVAAETQPGERWIIFNAPERVPHAPYLGDWAGIGGQFVFDALRMARGPILWAPPAESVPPDDVRTTWLMFYRANHERKGVRFDDDQFAAYLRALTATLGEPTHRSYRIKNEPGKQESIEVYRFDGASPKFSDAERLR